MAAAQPPETIYCPKCRDGGGVAPYCYQVDVTRTGVQLHAYRCPGCGMWLIIRWAPDRPAQYQVTDLCQEKPRCVRQGERIADAGTPPTGYLPTDTQSSAPPVSRRVTRDREPGEDG